MLDLLKQLLKNSRLVQHAYNWVQDKNIVCLDKRCLDYVATMIMDTGDKYLPSKDLISVLQVRGDYRFDDIREDDIVIDIGANIGGFSIPASRVSKYVYAVEPITVEELRKNIELNGRKITVLEVALGDGQPNKVSWGSQHKYMMTSTLGEIKELCGGCDFLKIDCEGSEWTIKPGELEGIRRIEMEVHTVKRLTTKKSALEEMGKRLEEAGFTCDLEIIRTGYHHAGPVGIIHAWRGN